ncbi:peptidoglycan hydrolase-like protein with peptidoglycan-binding domain [Lipingzhangella halophila]|uniref:Peptidoglycan hydrolase-like protein with peptidoglycan-binding domain n=1 Tax=Lipingzhangella halophila TaxID=1783352 RepID=A0A7W7RE16_9ACTN|nr:L,D-transpeptidase family protein [Lipingzhangella halophila]MBB4930095.1 peptidoglycan hydrolase-like protein with peptidoglycan-binding domain [Lipingzhangella halophila]
MPTPQKQRFGRRTAHTAALAAAVTVGLGIAAHPAAASAAPPATAHTLSGNAAPTTANSDLLREGDSGTEVTELQERLAELDYWHGGADGEFDGLTTQAVLALQKAAGIARDGVVGPDTREALDDEVRPEATTSYDNAVEIDLERQLLLVVSGGEVEQVFATSTGSGETYVSQGEERVATTPEGEFSVFREVDGWDHAPLGSLYRPKYFNGGIAIHGYESVPPTPASHGCARVSIEAMDWLWENGALDQGAPVIVR